jgi:transcriptional regulator with XRE-family HTH domain/tetratricopeptide (TPR) repeat protein
LTQRELADLADVHITTIKRMEKGATSRAHAPNLRRLAELLGVPPESLLGEPLAVATGQYGRMSALPPQLIGRQRELELVFELLASADGPQVVSLIGPRGVGKTALAHATACAVPDRLGIHTVVWTSGKAEELEPRGITRVGAPSASPAHILHAVGAAFGDEGIGARPLPDQERAALSLLSTRPTLLVVDNLDGLPEDELGALASLCQRLPRGARVLATGPGPLGIANEAVVRIAPLGHDDACDLVSREALRKQVELGPRDPSAIFDAVGGIPVLLIWCVGRMALESQTTAGVLGELAESDADAYEWCFSRLWRELPSDDCRSLLIAAATCSDSASRLFLGIVAGVSTPGVRDRALAQLTSQASLLSYDAQRDRYSMLPLTRCGALQQLGNGEDSDEVWHRAMGYFTQLTASYEDSPNASWSAVDPEIDNILSLAERCCRVGLWHQLAGLLRHIDQYLYVRSRWAEMRRYGDAVLENAASVGDELLLAHLRRDLAWVYMEFGERAGARDLALQAYEAFRAADDARMQSVCLRYVAQILIRERDFEDAEGYLLRSAKAAAKADSNLDLLAMLDNLHGCLRLEAEDYRGAETSFLRALHRKESLPEPDKFSMCAVLRNLGELALRQGHDIAAARRLRRCIDLCDETSRKDLGAGARLLLAELRASQGRADEAAELAQAAACVFSEVGLSSDLARARALLEGLAATERQVAAPSRS